ncbi:MAG: 4Fe-4S binding protein [Erysipelothrix sp.]|nr:4Fe-4S binding protein [Erysipelothrix sp.]
MPVLVNQDECISCEACVAVCPTGSMFMSDSGKAESDPDTCIDCNACIPTCPVMCIDEI